MLKHDQNKQYEMCYQDKAYELVQEDRYWVWKLKQYDAVLYRTTSFEGAFKMLESLEGVELREFREVKND